MWAAAIRRHLQRWQPTPPPSHLCHVNMPSCPSKLCRKGWSTLQVTSATPRLRGDDQLGCGRSFFPSRDAASSWSRWEHLSGLDSVEPYSSPSSPFLFFLEGVAGEGGSFHPSNQHDREQLVLQGAASVS